VQLAGAENDKEIDQHIEGDIILVDGVPEEYAPTAAAQAIREAVPAE
jgi:hypothetical protein